MLLCWTGRESDCILRISVPEGLLREFANPTPRFTYEETEAQRGEEIVHRLQQVGEELEFGSKSPDPQSALFTPH